MIIEELLEIMNSLNPSSAEEDMLNSNVELKVMPDEAACSHEFSKGCILSEDQAEQV